MKPIKSPINLLITRSAFCPECFKKGKPQKWDRFIVYGTDHQTFRQRTAHHGGLKGYTPHLYSIEFPYKLDEHQRVYVLRTCLMDGCGIELGPLKPNGNFTINFREATSWYLPMNDVDALVTRWKGWTGLTLI